MRLKWVDIKCLESFWHIVQALIDSSLLLIPVTMPALVVSRPKICPSHKRPSSQCMWSSHLGNSSLPNNCSWLLSRDTWDWENASKHHMDTIQNSNSIFHSQDWRHHSKSCRDSKHKGTSEYRDCSDSWINMQSNTHIWHVISSSTLLFTVKYVQGGGYL